MKVYFFDILQGFPYIEIDIVKQFARLVMPPFRREGRQFSQQENLDGYICASLRIHVERGISRLKNFGILNFVEHYLYKVSTLKPPIHADFEVNDL